MQAEFKKEPMEEQENPDAAPQLRPGDVGATLNTPMVAALDWTQPPPILPYAQTKSMYGAPGVAGMSRATLWSYNLFGFAGGQIHETIYGRNNAMSYAGVFGAMIKAPLCRNQHFAGQPNDNHRWETDANPGPNFFHYTFFPGVMHETVNGVPHVKVLTYCVLYSSEEPSHGPQGILPHEPAFVPYTPPPGIDSEPVFVDISLIGDVSSKAAFMTAINTAKPQRNAYLSIFPVVTTDDYRKRILAGHGGNWRVSGASLGIAIMAAVLGMPSILYTGYIRAMGPHAILARKLGKIKGTNAYYSADQARDGLAQGLYHVEAESDVIEDVAMLAYKVAYAIAAGFPIVIPNRSMFGQPLAAILASPEFTAQHYLLRAAGMSYTMTMAEQGQAFEVNKTPILIAATVSEAAALASYAVISYFVDAAQLGQLMVKGLTQAYAAAKNPELRTLASNRIVARKRKQKAFREMPLADKLQEVEEKAEERMYRAKLGVQEAEAAAARRQEIIDKRAGLTVRKLREKAALKEQTAANPFRTFKGVKNAEGTGLTAKQRRAMNLQAGWIPDRAKILAAKLKAEAAAAGFAPPGKSVKRLAIDALGPPEPARVKRGALKEVKKHIKTEKEEAMSPAARILRAEAKRKAAEKAVAAAQAAARATATPAAGGGAGSSGRYGGTAVNERRLLNWKSGSTRAAAMFPQGP